jgi:arginyl-tRNA--protein-N-Asp/Glu arginylyltransferase
MQDKVRTRHYVMTLHAVEEMDDDGLSVFDVERIILTGEIIERQIDYQSREEKYLIMGHSLSDDQAIVATKISPTGKLVIITVYLV